MKPRRFPLIEELDGLSMTKPESELSEDIPVAELLKTAHKGNAAASVLAGAALISLLAALALVLWLIKTLLAIV